MRCSNFPGVIEDLCDIILSGNRCLSTDELKRIRESGEGDQDGDVTTRLGEYQPMASPGTIRLFWKPLGNLVFGAWKHLVATELVLEDDSVALRNTCRIVVGKTYFHEQLHFMWDYAGHCKVLDRTCSKNPHTEEALATAWSWYFCHEYGRQIWTDNQPAVEAIVRFCFDGITLAGYRDWKNHAHGCFFETTFANYFNLQAFNCPDADDPRDRISDFYKQVVAQGALCNFEILDQRNGTLHSTYDGSHSAFPDWDFDTVIHTPNNCYPKSNYDFRGIPRHSPSGEDIQNHLLADSCLSAEDIFLCHRNDLESLHFMHEALKEKDRKWKRLCLRHNTNQITHILNLVKTKSLESVFIDPFPLQQIVASHINCDSSRDPLDFQQDLFDNNFDEQAEFK